ncbi:MAG: CpsD/CapB family tyrosine-protein kinase, partial [Propionibacteriaceae bacterium]|nr:CpsD/CapB family tyrosine-protein kinase [Propionibacteriaceae bacterium]
FIAADETNVGRAFVISSSLPGEGKTTISLNLATVLAEAGERVLLIDGDLRRPRIAKYLGLETKIGLTTVLIGKASPGDVLQKTQIKNLTVMASGGVPPNPSELLASKGMEQLLDTARNLFNYIIVDSAPLLPVTDAAILSRQTDGIIVVGDVSGTTVPQLETALDSVRSANGTVLGIVLNKLNRERRSHSQRYGYYYYGQEYYEENESQNRQASRAKKKNDR